MNILDVEPLALKLMKEHSLEDWTFKLNTNKNRLGVCKWRKKRIEISMFHGIKDSIESVTNTILHEIAHALTPGHMHDETWRTKALEIGCNGERCGDDMGVEKKFIGHCPNCNKEIRRHRRKNIACGKCCRMFNQGKFDYKFKIIWTKK